MHDTCHMVHAVVSEDRREDGSSAGPELTLAVDHGDLRAEDAEQPAVIVEG